MSETKADDTMTIRHRVKNVYHAGMQLAEALRKLQMHEEANEIEIWVLKVVNERTRNENN